MLRREKNAPRNKLPTLTLPVKSTSYTVSHDVTPFPVLFVGLAKVDETEKGWFVQYIDRDPEAIKRQEAAAAKEKMKMDDEEKTAKFIEQQVEKAQREGKETPASEFTELQRENEEEKGKLWSSLIFMCR